MGYNGAPSQLALESTPGYGYISEMLEDTDAVNVIYFPGLKQNLVIVNDVPTYLVSGNHILHIRSWPQMNGVYYAEFRAGGDPKYLLINSAGQWLMYTQENSLRHVPESQDWFIDISIPIPAEA